MGRIIKYLCYLLDSGDKIIRLGHRRYERLQRGLTSIPGFAGMRVRYAGVLVELLNGKPSLCLRAEYLTIPFTVRGTIDRYAYFEEAVLLVRSPLDPPNDGKVRAISEGNMVRAERAFKVKRARSLAYWQPTPELARVILRRALLDSA